ncbi:MAG: M3 family oligoendopeptidase, partial [Chitinophagaceae bacterium]|nr:M3 family oligoendopeptidase [Anaerolineae bacterium]
MVNTLPKNAQDALDWKADQFSPYFNALIERDITADNVTDWLTAWSDVAKLTSEVASRLSVATTVDTTDEASENRLKVFLDEVFPVLAMSNHMLNQKLLASGLQPEGFEIPLRNIKAESELFREENLSLQSEEGKLRIDYDKVIGVQSVTWDGQEVTLPALSPVYQEQDRARREKAWRLSMTRTLQDREALNALWVQFMDLRGQIAANAGLPDYRAYAWKAMKRFDYTPEDSETFQKAIEEVVVPAAKRLYERRQSRLGVDSLRPWDLAVEPSGASALHPYETIAELENTLGTIFDQVDPALGGYYRTMKAENLLDLDNRKGKAPGGYCTTYAQAERPFIFMNAVGLHNDVQTLLHEGGHAFHAFESFSLPYIHQQDVPMEFAEVASMAMELIASPYLAKSVGGFYSESDAARARVEHLESMIRFWPYMAVVDAFQHWVYTNHQAASNPANCDAKWAELWDSFMQG